jgi:predicted DNA-binding transcriptional regulator AlpA
VQTAKYRTEAHPPSRPDQKGTPIVTQPPRDRKSPRDKLTIRDVCTDLEIGRSTFYEWRAKNTAPPCIKLPNGQLRILRADYDAWLSAHKEAA